MISGYCIYTFLKTIPKQEYLLSYVFRSLSLSQFLMSLRNK